MGRSRRPIVFVYGGSFLSLDNGSQVRAAEAMDYLHGLDGPLICYGWNETGAEWDNEHRERFARRYPRARLIVERGNWAIRAQLEKS